MTASEETEGLVFFKGEVQLAGWSESHTGGAKVVMWLPGSSDLDPFRAATVRKGDKAGQRFMMVLVEIGDDEQPIPPQQAPRTEPQHKKGGGLARLAGLWCQTPRFQEWLHREYPQQWALALESYEEPSDEELAAEVIRLVCDIGSRAELDHDARAAATFHELVRLPFSREL